MCKVIHQCNSLLKYGIMNVLKLHMLGVRTRMPTAYRRQEQHLASHLLKLKNQSDDA
jgi:hypothetical protein